VTRMSAVATAMAATWNRRMVIMTWTLPGEQAGRERRRSDAEECPRRRTYRSRNPDGMPWLDGGRSPEATSAGRQPRALSWTGRLTATASGKTGRKELARGPARYASRWWTIGLSAGRDTRRCIQMGTADYGSVNRCDSKCGGTLHEHGSCNVVST